MNFSFVIKVILISFFVFILIFSLSYISTQKAAIDSNNFGVKNTIKQSLNIGELRASGDITFDDDTLLKYTIDNYLKNNNINSDDVTFGVSVNSDIVTVKIILNKNIFNSTGGVIGIFSYRVIKK